MNVLSNYNSFSWEFKISIQYFEQRKCCLTVGLRLFPFYCMSWKSYDSHSRPSLRVAATLERQEDPKISHCWTIETKKQPTTMVSFRRELRSIIQHSSVSVWCLWSVCSKTDQPFEYVCLLCRFSLRDHLHTSFM